MAWSTLSTILLLIAGSAISAEGASPVTFVTTPGAVYVLEGTKATLNWTLAWKDGVQAPGIITEEVAIIWYYGRTSPDDPLMAYDVTNPSDDLSVFHNRVDYIRGPTSASMTLANVNSQYDNCKYEAQVSSHDNKLLLMDTATMTVVKVLEMAFAEQARSHRLSEETIKALLDEGYDNTEDLMMMEQSDMDHLQIQRAQHGRLRKWINELKASGPASDKVTPAASVTIANPESESCHTSGSTQSSERLGAVRKDINVVKTPQTDQDSEHGSTQSFEGISNVFNKIKMWSTKTDPGSEAAKQSSKHETSTKAQSTNKGPHPKKEPGFFKLPIEDDIVRGLDPKTAEAVKEYIKAKGVAGVGQYLDELLSEYRNKLINIAVTGPSGVGKSSFINCVRDLTGDDKGAAKVGATETTMEPHPYPHPDHKKLILWDLPGIGTPKFPRENYLKRIEMDRYDLFLIVSSNRFTENDVFLAEEVHRLGKRFFLLRTKIDVDLKNDKMAHPRTHDPKNVFAQVEQDCKKNLEEHGLPTDLVFIISTRLDKRVHFDFPSLMKNIIDKAPAEKKTSLILSLTACSEEAMQAKKADFEKRIPTVAKRATLDTENVSQKESLIEDEIEHYRTSFGLSEEAIAKMGVDPKSLSQQVSSIVGGKIRKFFGWISDLFTSQTREEDMETAQKMIKDKLCEILNKCASASEEIISEAQKSSVEATI